MAFSNRRICPPRRPALLFLFLIAVQSPIFQQLTAAPHATEGLVIDWTQPDGTKLKLRFFGDEFYAKAKEGVTVAYNAEQHTNI